jgi:hypothetical protein
MIIRFLHNERAHAHDTTQIRQAQFAHDAYGLRTAQFWIGEVRLIRQEPHDKNRIRRLPLDDLHTKNLAILDIRPFESVRSIAESIPINLAKVLWR